MNFDEEIVINSSTYKLCNKKKKRHLPKYTLGGSNKIHTCKSCYQLGNMQSRYIYNAH